MEVIFQYEENEYLPIKTISVIGKFNNYNPSEGLMVEENNKWIFKCNLPSGEHPYKFLINGELKLNDSTANIYFPDDNEELWSIVMINENDQRMYNNTQYTTHIEKYNISSVISEEEDIVNKKSFNMSLDKKIVTRFQFTNVTGLHAVTTVWYTPKGELFQITENNLFKPPNNEEPIRLWFWMDLDDNTRNYPLGTWTMKLFIDGEFILEDEFSLVQNTTYSVQGKYR
ncbi:glycoside hydrolase [Clostridium tetani]|uniref:AMP-activated protein kinase glycogen-binding domain-containing protein n=1 Tax=Clostridium tetani TaxID=1513 RepID=A0ABY0EQB0_CLOTA|nr:glycoside hydrolase [Clostridium tetani]CDI49662.1 glycoside hydrolase [Clostridium tetani 12124569]KHO39048.1 hypothetical protein OR62_08060 [Clostridium tetani]RXI38072.1 hypothetical protein DP129_12020 [Clostridium tetani]RXI52372.1 hypothetical protein DP131_12605 [Clostridium tetani]RXI70011.1 hypothetical protein DQN76_07295 [Clostridium tetani]